MFLNSATIMEGKASPTDALQVAAELLRHYRANSSKLFAGSVSGAE